MINEFVLPPPLSQHPARTGNPGNEMNVLIVNNPESIAEKKSL
jgi:hypothetical protein